MPDALFFVELRDEPEERRRALLVEFYDNVYRPAFPEPNETEGPDTWLRYMTGAPVPKKPDVYVLLACGPADNILGGLIFEFYRTSGCWLATYLCVREANRCQGIARELVRRAHQAMSSAQRTPDVVLFAETEIPRRVPAGTDRDAAIVRLQTLGKLGFRHIPINYWQPALAEGKQAIDTLFLLNYVGDQSTGETASCQSDRVAAFLAEFYVALDADREGDVYHLEEMLADLKRSSSAACSTMELEDIRDATLGKCQSLSIRLLFLEQLTERGRRIELPMSQFSDDATHESELSGERCREAREQLLEPISSFCGDIMIAYAGEQNMPVIVLCEPVSDAGDKGERAFTDTVGLSLAGHLRMNWEDHECALAFPETTAKFFDAFAFFESGIIAYSATFVFDGGGQRDVDLDQDVLLAISAMMQSAGTIAADSPRLQFSFLEGSRAACELPAFIRNRIADLKAASDAADGDESPLVNVFSWLRRSRKPQHGMDVLTDDRLAKLFEAIDIGWDNRQTFVDIEVIGASLQDDVLTCAQQAKKRIAPANSFTKRLSGLVQNVQDYDKQDEEEINDSLAGALMIGTDITFVSQSTATKFCMKSRATDKGRKTIGGSPYWFLVQIVLGHNEALLTQFSAAENGAEDAWDIHGLIEALDRGNNDAEKARYRVASALKRKLRLSYYIPNVFRYTTEQQLYELYAGMRGIDLRRTYLAGREAAAERAVEQLGGATKEKNDETFTKTLIALGIIQIAGILAAVAAISREEFKEFGSVLDPFAGLQHVVQFFKIFTLREDPQLGDASFSPIWALFFAVVFITGGGLMLGRVLWTSQLRAATIRPTLEFIYWFFVALLSTWIVIWVLPGHDRHPVGVPLMLVLFALLIVLRRPVLQLMEKWAR